MAVLAHGSGVQIKMEDQNYSENLYSFTQQFETRSQVFWLQVQVLST